MAVLPIYVAPHPVLKKIADPVDQVTDAHRKLIEDMLETMYAAPGIGLAALQVGVPDPRDRDGSRPAARAGNVRRAVS